jgi:uncharacterized RDD family membrane protein YckC
MRCPRCHGETGHAAIRCADCGAPLALPDEQPARPLDRPLELDRRGGRAAPAEPTTPARPPPWAREPLHPASSDDLDAGEGAEVIPVAPPDEVLELRRGGSARRVAAWAVDGLPFLLAGLGLTAWLGADLAVAAPVLAFVAVASFAYQTLAHWLAGATLGKRLVGLRVVGPDGGRPGPGRSALRAAAAVAGTAFLGLGPLLALFTRSGRGLHDLVAGTVVVDALTRSGTQA